MGQKVHPYGLRLGINKTWKSNWYLGGAGGEYAKALHEDLQIRSYIRKAPETSGADISDIEILRQSKKKVTVIIHTSRPGIIIGQSGASIKKLNDDLQKKFEGKTINVKIAEIKKEGLDATLLAMSVAKQLEGRSSFRRAMVGAINNAMKSGAKGIKVKVSGRLGGVDMARSTEIKEGRVPLHTLRADIDYGFAEANTTYGVLGVKVWLFKGEVLGKPRAISHVPFSGKKKDKDVAPRKTTKKNNNGAKDA